MLIKYQNIKFDVLKVKIIGIIIEISISKIRKIIIIKKKCKEKGSRADIFGSNPHSKGDMDSKFKFDFFERINAKVKTIVVNNLRKMKELIMLKINYIKN